MGWLWVGNVPVLYERGLQAANGAKYYLVNYIMNNAISKAKKVTLYIEIFFSCSVNNGQRNMNNWFL